MTRQTVCSNLQGEFSDYDCGGHPRNMSEYGLMGSELRKIKFTVCVVGNL